jgi:hypothetical protein
MASLSSKAPGAIGLAGIAVEVVEAVGANIMPEHAGVIVRYDLERPRLVVATRCTAAHIEHMANASCHG